MALIFTTLNTSQLKKLMNVKLFLVYILCIWVLIMRVDILKEKMEINIWFLILLTKKKSIKKYAGVCSGIKNKIKTINRDKRKWLRKRLHEN